jgi:hypothetical protein
MLDTTATAPETQTDGPDRVSSHVRRMVLMVVAFQVLAIVVAVVLFSAMGLANDGTGSCGGG